MNAPNIRTRQKHLRYCVQTYMRWNEAGLMQVVPSSEQSRQIGSGDGSERIRTYNFPQGCVTDHRVGITSHSIDGVMQGENLDTFLDALLLRQEMDALLNSKLKRKFLFLPYIFLVITYKETCKVDVRPWSSPYTPRP